MKTMIRIHALLVLFLTCCTLTYAQQAVEEEKKDPTIHLFEVVTVTADMEPQGSPTTISEITAEQLQSRNAGQ